MKESCLFCGCTDRRKRPSDTEYVCGICVTQLLKFNQEEFERGCRFIDRCLKIISSGRGLDNLKMKEKYERKKRAIEMIMKKGNYDGRQANPRYRAEECINGRNLAQTIRHFQGDAGLFETGEKATLYQDNQ